MVSISQAIKSINEVSFGIMLGEKGAPNEKSHKSLLFFVGSALIDVGLGTPMQNAWWHELRACIPVKKCNPAKTVSEDAFKLPRIELLPTKQNNDPIFVAPP